jgi:hypothetical protein
MKVFGGGQLLNADFGLKMVGKKKCTASKSAAFFFAPFFWASKKKGEWPSPKDSPKESVDFRSDNSNVSSRRATIHF